MFNLVAKSVRKNEWPVRNQLQEFQTKPLCFVVAVLLGSCQRSYGWAPDSVMSAWLACSTDILALIIRVRKHQRRVSKVCGYMLRARCQETQKFLPASPRKYWSRKEIAEWLLEQIDGERPVLVGIDHGFSFPLKYFEKYKLPFDWPSFSKRFSALLADRPRICSFHSPGISGR